MTWVNIIHKNRIGVFIKEYPDSNSSLSLWIKVIGENSCRHFSQIKQTFSSADYVKPYTIFNISGNKYRLVTLINYSLQLAAVVYVLTHAEYDRGRWRK